MDVEQGDHGCKLHERLLHGDVIASSEIAEQFLFIVIEQLRRRYPYLDDPHLVDTAVHEAFMRYFQHPERYDPSKSSLASYLLMAAEGDLRNNLSAAPYTRVIALDGLKYDELSIIMQLADCTANAESDPLGDISIVWSYLGSQLPDPVDREIVQAMLDQEHKTAVYATILGIENRPQKEQQLIVKRRKDRLRKKLRRALDPAEFRNND